MKAAVWRGPSQLSVEEVPIPKPGSDEVLIRTRAVGVCGSDLEVYEGRYGHARPPLILGHEGCGIVEDLGKGVGGIERGMRVVVEGILRCGSCAFCREGRYGLCENGRTLGMIGADGEYAEYFKAPAENCHPLPAGIDWIRAALTDTLAGPTHGLQGVKLPEGGTAAVFGAGPAGLFFCALLKDRGASTVYLIDVQDHRLGLGTRFGADRLIYAGRDDTVELIREATDGGGVDLVVEAAGSATALGEGLNVLRKGGYLLIYGLFGGAVTVDIQLIQSGEFTVVGSCGLDYPGALRFIERNVVPVDLLVTHRFDLESLVSAFSSGLISEQRQGYIKGLVLFHERENG